jgi:enamine deaminase RidA (YjgF/YER057c/UK114 family)
MTHALINPETLGAPKGYSHGVLARPGRLLFVAGMVGWSRDQRFESASFPAQFEQALANAMAVVREAGGEAADVCRLTVYVTDKRQYLAALREVGAGYRRVMGRHFPAMALVEVSGLVEDGALVEIECTAVIGEDAP